MGLPNTGKTSILNSLLPLSKRTHAVAAQTPLSKAAKHPAPTTLAPVEVVVDLGEGMVVRVVDTPGWEFADEEEEEEGGGEGEGKQEEKEGKWDEMEERVAGDLLRRNLGRVDRVKDVTPLGQSLFSFRYLNVDGRLKLIWHSGVYHLQVEPSRSDVSVQRTLLPPRGCESVFDRFGKSQRASPKGQLPLPLPLNLPEIGSQADKSSTVIQI